MNSGAKHVLDALDPNAYEAFKASRNLQDVVERVLHNEQEVEKEPGRRRALSVQASLMTPVQPMLVRVLLGPASSPSVGILSFLGRSRRV